MRKPSVLQIYVVVSIMVAVTIAAMATMGEVSLNHQGMYCVEPVTTGECQLDYMAVGKLFLLPFVLCLVAAAILGACLASVYLAVRWLWRKMRG